MQQFHTWVSDLVCECWSIRLLAKVHEERFVQLQTAVLAMSDADNSGKKKETRQRERETK
jgi:hypothetical protein